MVTDRSRGAGNAELYLGVDLGGTAVKIGVCSGNGRVCGRVAIPTEAARGPEDTVDRIGAAALELMETTGYTRICGTGIPGPLGPERRLLIRASNLPGWTDVPFPELLGHRLGIPTVLENDANCAAWGESRVGVGQGARSLVFFSLGTGVGGGVVVDGELWTGSNGGAGRLGHLSIDPNGPWCSCGQRGCLEQYASATAVARRYGRGTARDVFDAARRGNPEATAVIDGAADALAAGVASVIQVLDPELIVLGGGMAAAGDLLLDRVRAGVRRRVLPGWVENVRIEASALGVDAGWIGAALWAARSPGFVPQGAGTARTQTPLS